MATTLRIAKNTNFKKKDIKTKKDNLYKKALYKISHSKPLSKKEAKEIARRKRVAKKLAKLNAPATNSKNYIGIVKDHRLPKSIPRTPSTFSYTPRSHKTNSVSTSKSIQNSSSKKTFSFDHNNPADEYEARNIEFGHGRKKSREWNDTTAKELQKELEQLRKEKPDWTDRFAMK